VIEMSRHHFNVGNDPTESQQMQENHRIEPTG
jgi:hypothetical protein